MENQKERNLLKSYNAKHCENCSVIGEKLGVLAHNIASETIKNLKSTGENGIAGMEDLSLINGDNLNEIDFYLHRKDIKVGDIFTINGFGYKIVDDMKMIDGIQDGNYYDILTKKFIVICNNGGTVIEYSYYKRSLTLIEKKTGKVFGKNDLMIEGFIGEIGEVLSTKKNRDSETGCLINCYKEYKGMIGKYDIGIGHFEGEVKNTYGSFTKNCVGFEGIGFFELYNRIKLIGNFNIEHYIAHRKIYGIGKIVYPDGKEEVGFRGGKAELYERIYKKDDF